MNVKDIQCRTIKEKIAVYERAVDQILAPEANKEDHLIACKLIIRIVCLREELKKLG